MIRSQKPTVHSQSSKNETIQSPSHAGAIASYIGKILTLHHTQFVVEDILGQGGSAFVFLVRSFNQRRFALKRMYVNNQHDLHVCQREISIVKEFSSHRNIIKYVDSFIHRLPPTNIQRSQYYAGGNKDEENDDDTIYEILLLTEYCSNGPLVVSNRAAVQITNLTQVTWLFYIQERFIIQHKIVVRRESDFSV